MPIDIRLLRDGSSVDQVERWQNLRRRKTDTDGGTRIRLEHLILLDQEYRQALKTQNKYKSACRQEKKRPDAELLQRHQQDCDDLLQQLERDLCSLCNAVDETALAAYLWQKSAVGGTTINASISKSPFRRLVELGAWEVLGNLQQENTTFCWTGTGARWGDALSNYLKDTVQQGQRCQELWLPPTFSLEGKAFHDMMGCTKYQPEGACIVCEKGTDASFPAPSWLEYLRLQYTDQTIGDKQLPSVLHFRVRRTRDSASTMLDAREQLREKSSSFLPAAKGMESTIHNILILTSSTYVDSRTAQKEWIKRLSDYYLSLLPDDCENPKQHVRQRVVTPSDLLPAEASRVVVEGHLPATDQWILLAYISNFSDFPSRACRIKNNQQQFCHVLQGTLCSVPETMCWQASHSKGSLQFPAALCHYHPDDVVPQVKTFDTTKNGRLQLKSISLEDCKPASAKKKPSSIRKDGPSRIKVLELNGKASNQQIKGEALCTPFNFLPFYQSLPPNC